jgi:hypothetical protein
MTLSSVGSYLRFKVSVVPSTPPASEMRLSAFEAHYLIFWMFIAPPVSGKGLSASIARYLRFKRFEASAA